MKLNITLFTGFVAGFSACALMVIAIDVYNSYKKPPNKIKVILQGSYDGKTYHSIDSLEIAQP